MTRPPRFSPAASRAFDLTFNPWRRRRLHTAPLLGMPRALPRDRPLLLVANHTSWWDGFLLRDVHQALRPQAPMHTVMSARELARFPFLRLLGAVPVEAGSPASTLRLLRSLERAAHADPAVTVAMFPQGVIAPAWSRPLGFRRGVELVARALAPCWVLPVSIHVEPLNRTAPTAFVTAGPPLHVTESSVDAALLEELVTRRLDDVARVLASHGEHILDHLGQLA